MITASAERPREFDERIETEVEQLRLIYSAVPLSLAAILINGTILTAVLWDIIPAATNLTWLGMVYAVSLYRWVTFRRFTSAPAGPQGAGNWLTPLAAGTLLSGLLWGLASLLMFPQQSMLHQVFLAFVIAGMSAGAVTTLSAIFSLSAVFLLLALMPLIWRFTVAGNSISHVMAFMTTLFFVMVVVASFRLSRTILETLQIRHENRQAEETIRYQALYDELTDLPNRRMLLNQLGQEMARSTRHGHIGAVLFLDLDHFKTINDSLGHRVGDKLLQLVATRIKERIRKEDTASRLGGDEFVVLVPEVGDEEGIAIRNIRQVAGELLQLFRDPFSVQGHELHLSASIGIALFPMGLEVIAEGVETAAALEFLRAKGCRQFQGYLFGRPEPFEGLVARLEVPLATGAAR